MTTALIQPRFVPIEIPLQCIYLFAISKGFLDSISNIFMQDFEAELINFISTTFLSKILFWITPLVLPEDFLNSFLPTFVENFLDFVTEL